MFFLDFVSLLFLSVFLLFSLKEVFLFLLVEFGFFENYATRKDEYGSEGVGLDGCLADVECSLYLDEQRFFSFLFFSLLSHSPFTLFFFFFTF